MRNSKVVTLEEAIRRSGLKDGMTISFHHHFRGGDKVVNMVVDKLAGMGVRFFNLPVPTSVGVLLSSDMLEKIGCADQGKMLRYMFAQENENVFAVNAFNHLIAHNDEYIYYNSVQWWSEL